MRCWLMVLASVTMLCTTGCWPGIVEMLQKYDFETDPNGDGTYETARFVPWIGNAAYADGAISLDDANIKYTQSYLPDTTVVGNFVPPPSEVDIFALGQLASGTEISIEYWSLAESIGLSTTAGSATGASIGLRLGFVLTDATGTIIGYPAAAAVPVPADGEYFIVVHTGTEDMQFPFDYQMIIRRNTAAPTRAPRTGTLLLRFDGATDVDIAFPGDSMSDIVHIEELPAFDFDTARPDLAGQFGRFKRLVRALVEYVYAEYDIVVTLDPDRAAAMGHHDVLIFTSADASIVGLSTSPLGIEPGIDIEDTSQQIGIIFIDSGNDNRFATDLYEYAAYWANVAAHEYGHGLGLIHSEQEHEGLMAPHICGSSGACGRTIKSLIRAPLYGQTLLYQDPAIYLPHVVGYRNADDAQAIRERIQDFLTGGDTLEN
jgi:hypothetical protein